jgi:hypothetical protein
MAVLGQKALENTLLSNSEEKLRVSRPFMGTVAEWCRHLLVLLSGQGSVGLIDWPMITGVWESHGLQLSLLLRA